MKIDRTHKPWAWSVLAIFLASAALYRFHLRWTGHPRGNTIIGLSFGVVGYALMLFAVALGARKHFPTRRLGRASTWMRGHIWLGFLSFPLLLFHAGFAANGPLTYWLTVLLIATIATGIVGALAQHFVPRLMTRLVPLETIYEQIPHVRRQLLARADELMMILGATVAQPVVAWAGHATIAATGDDDHISGVHDVEQFYAETVRPYLADPDRIKNACASAEQSAVMFASMERNIPDHSRDALRQLAAICEEQRQLKRQKLIYRLLHYWLLAHVPLSFALVVLGAIHGIAAVLY